MSLIQIWFQLVGASEEVRDPSDSSALTKPCLSDPRTVKADEGEKAAVAKEKVWLNLCPKVSTRKISDRVRADPAAKNFKSVLDETEKPPAVNPRTREAQGAMEA